MPTKPRKGHLTEAQKLRERLEPLLEPGERLMGAFVALAGPRPAAELVAPLDVAPLLLDMRHRERRTSVTIAVTDQSVKIYKNKGSWWSWATGSKRPDLLLRRYDKRTVLGKTGDNWIDVNGERFWLHLVWLDEARRLSRLGS